MTPDQSAVRDARNAMGALLLAAAFTADPAVWPGFQAFVERQTGHQYPVGPETMLVALQIGEELRAELEKAMREGPGDE